MIDSHCHLTYPDLADDLTGVLQRAAAAGVDAFVNICTRHDDALRALDQLHDRRNVALVLGVHPHEAGRGLEEWERVRALFDEFAEETSWASRIVGVGETGLDFHYDFAPRKEQQRMLEQHAEFAQHRGLPLVIHAREAEERVCDVLRDFPELTDRVVFHCFSGSPETARRILNDGYWLSFTGVITFKNAAGAAEAARMCPAERMMLETDAPYLAPAPHRNRKPNEPELLIHTARKAAELRQTPFEDLVRQTVANTRRFFRLKEPAT